MGKNNFFKINTPIGRKQFFINSLIIGVYAFTCVAIIFTLHAFFEVNKYNLILFILLWGIFIITQQWLLFVNYAKRIWDISTDKSNAIFYTIAIFIVNTTLPFIPAMKYIGIVFSLGIVISMLSIKGRCVQNQTSTDNETK